MNILIIPQDSVAGVLFSTPIIRNLKTSLEAIVDCYVEQNHWVLQENPYLNQIYSIDNPMSETQYDYIIDLNNITKWSVDVSEGNCTLVQDGSTNHQSRLVGLYCQVNQLVD